MASPWVTQRSIGFGALASLAGVGAATALIYGLREFMPVQGAAVVYLLPVLLVSAYWGWQLGVATSMLSAAAFEFFHLEPAFGVSFAHGEDWVALGVFIVVALVTAVLSGTVRGLAEEQAALRRVATQVAEAGPPSEIFEIVTREIGLHSGADMARMERYEQDGTVVAVAAWSQDGNAERTVGHRFTLEGASIAARVRETGRPVRVDSFTGEIGPIATDARALGIRSSVGCPIVVGGRIWGVVAASSTTEKAFPANTEAEIAEFTDLVAMAIANAENRDELIASRARVVAAADEARRRIQRDLHDGAQQRLVHATINLKLGRRALKEGDPEAEKLLGEALEHAEKATEELRDLSHGLLPSVLTRRGLRAGVESLASRMSMPVQIEVCEERFSSSVEATAYFIVSEALTNVVKHSGAERAWVEADTNAGLLRVEVRDDGTGGANIEGGSGLVGLHDRAAALDGKLEVESLPGQGTRIVATLPVPN